MTQFLFCHKSNRDQRVDVQVCQKNKCEYLESGGQDAVYACNCSAGYHYVDAWKKIRKERKGGEME